MPYNKQMQEFNVEDSYINACPLSEDVIDLNHFSELFCVRGVSWPCHIQGIFPEALVQAPNPG